jgi:hypothetical protein
MAVWKCPTAAEGDSGCKCCCKSKQAALGKRKAGGRGYTSPKKRKWMVQRNNESQKGDQ